MLLCLGFLTTKTTCMNQKRKGWVDVQPLIEQVSFEQAARHYGVTLQLERTSGEVRTKCFLLNCGKTAETGDRAMAIDLDRKRFRCHHYGCTVGGGLLDLMFRLKHGREPSGGKLRGDEFKEIVADLQAIVGGEEPVQQSNTGEETPTSNEPAEYHVNIPLKDAENEHVRALASLNNMLIVEPADMSPKASQYSRKHGLTPEVCRRARCGYMPHSAKSSLRGTWVYGVFDEQDDALAWIGRDLLYEEKHKKWLAGGKIDREPNKYRFPKGFHRGLELYGQDRLPETKPDQLRDTGLIVVEGFNDVIRMNELGEFTLGIMSNQMTTDQAARLATIAREKAGGRVSLMLDNDLEGENGAKQALWTLAQHGVDIRLAWSRTMHGGRFDDRQPEHLDDPTWTKLRSRLAIGSQPTNSP
jgi:5S rRNA maturation endonuclease (ribonuclease M5)